jgi:type IV fimbrial biogenesis protein FimT
VPKQTTAFTLQELLIVVAILSITVSLAIPAYNSFVARNQLVTYTNQLLFILNFARHYAVTSRYRIGICPSSDGLRCGAQWEKGLVVFQDTSHSGIISAENKVLYRLPAFKSGYRLSWNRQANLIKLSPFGMLQSQNGTWMLCNPTAGCKAIVISQTGRARSEDR